MRHGDLARTEAGDNLMDIHMARMAILHTAWLLDKGERASNGSSMSKVVCSEAIARVADRSMQILGGMGMTRDTVVERIFRDTRAGRIYDGPSEVHRWALGARIVSGKIERLRAPAEKIARADCGP